MLYLLQGVDKMRPRKGFGQKNGSQIGRKSGGRGRNRTDECRHPELKKRREQNE